jgi:hypothetical protein
MPLTSQSKSGPKYLSAPIFPLLEIRAPVRPAPSAQILLAPWHSKLLHNTSAFSISLLQNRR